MLAALALAAALQADADWQPFAALRLLQPEVLTIRVQGDEVDVGLRPHATRLRGLCEQQRVHVGRNSPKSVEVEGDYLRNERWDGRAYADAEDERRCPSADFTAAMAAADPWDANAAFQVIDSATADATTPDAHVEIRCLPDRADCGAEVARWLKSDVRGVTTTRWVDGAIDRRFTGRSDAMVIHVRGQGPTLFLTLGREVPTAIDPVLRQAPGPVQP